MSHGSMKNYLRILSMPIFVALICAADIGSEDDAILDAIDGIQVDSELLQDTLSDMNYWDAAQAAYNSGSSDKDEGGTYNGWYVNKVCETKFSFMGFDMGSSVAKFLTHVSSNEKVLAFAGSDDGSDWAHNLNAGSSGWHGSTVHAGFKSYVQSLESCIESYYSTHNPSKMVGHSLGGAAASLYALKKGLLTTHTFGAPPTVWGIDQCRIPGKRILHERDPVGSLKGCIGARFLNVACIGINLDNLKHDVHGWKVTDTSKPTKMSCNYKGEFSLDTLAAVADTGSGNNAHTDYHGDIELLEAKHFGGAKTMLLQIAPGRFIRAIDYGHYLSKE